jgi:hypothetical protein
MDRLSRRLAEGLRVDPQRVPTRPSAAARARRIDDKRRRGALKRRRAERPDERT